VFTINRTRDYKVNYLQAGLFPPGSAAAKPWSSIAKDIRDQVDGIMVLKIGFTEQDLALFPRLKV
jgi:C-terminal binding protein